MASGRAIPDIAGDRPDGGPEGLSIPRGEELASKSIMIVGDGPAISTPVVGHFRNLGHTVDAATEVEEAGALLGVAHEVRNPLFSISATGGS